MKIKIRYQHFDLNEDMKDRLIKRVRFALSRFGSEINHVQIHFTDTNGPKSGQDINCLFSVKLISSEKIVTNARGSDLLSALHFSVERTKRALIRKLQKGRLSHIRLDRRRQNEKFDTR